VSSRRSLLWVLAFAALAVAGGGLLSCGGAGGPDLGPNRVVTATVTRVVDGDTVKVRIGHRRETVRYIGKAASAYNRRLVAGQPVRLRVGAEPRDRYGRLLAYVYRRRDGLFVNAVLVRDGYATTLTIPPNDAQAAQLARLERSARRAGRGLWRACT